MNNTHAHTILNFTSRFQLGAQKITRYEGNPYVKGDNVAEHLCRLFRLLSCVASELKTEFPGVHGLIEDISMMLQVHDDDEIISGFDVATALKEHDVKNEEEIDEYHEAISELPIQSIAYLFPLFTSFRAKSSLQARIAKVLDNIVGNQLVIEQEYGLVNPDQARFAYEYVTKWWHVSKTTDALIQAQIHQMTYWRSQVLQKVQAGQVETFEFGITEEKVIELLSVDLLTHKLDKEKINLPLYQL